MAFLWTGEMLGATDRGEGKTVPQGEVIHACGCVFLALAMAFAFLRQVGRELHGLSEEVCSKEWRLHCGLGSEG